MEQITFAFLSLATPPAKVTACPSAIPTSHDLSGNLFMKGSRQDPSDIAGVTTTSIGSSSPILTNCFPKTFGKVGSFEEAGRNSQVSGSKGLTPWKVIGSFS